HTVDDAGMNGMAKGVEYTASDHDRGERMNPCMHIGEIGNIGAQHDERAVQNVDDVEDAPDQREADGDASVEAAQHESIRSNLPIDHDRGARAPKLCWPRRVNRAAVAAAASAGIRGLRSANRPA